MVKSSLMTQARNLHLRTLRLVTVSTVIYHAVNLLLPSFYSDFSLMGFFCVPCPHSHPCPCLPRLTLFSIRLVLTVWKGSLLAVRMRKSFLLQWSLWPSFVRRPFNCFSEMFLKRQIHDFQYFILTAVDYHMI